MRHFASEVSRVPCRFAVAERVDIHDFLRAHARPGLGAEPCFLLGLSRGPDSVFDLHDERGRTLVAILTDRCDNSGDAAELVFLACRDDMLAADVLATCLDATIVEARRGPRANLEIVVADVVQPHRALLASRGLDPRFEMVAMEKRAAYVAVAAPDGWVWYDLAVDDHPELVALGRAAFQGHPGVNFAPADHVDPDTLRRTPPIRLLRDGRRLIGAVSVRRDRGGLGMIEIIQRHPDYAGQRCGPVLLTEALRLLEDVGCDAIRLDAAVTNRRALTLYERFGFKVTEVMPVYGVATPA